MTRRSCGGTDGTMPKLFRTFPVDAICSARNIRSNGFVSDICVFAFWFVICRSVPGRKVKGEGM